VSPVGCGLVPLGSTRCIERTKEQDAVRKWQALVVVQAGE
jgi:hypothetical protein